ncbi:MAG: histidine phosphatase family protein [Chloroflexota bacterium]
MSLSTRVYIVRHGRTAWNRVERFRGTIDVPLDDEGLRQAEATAVALRGADDFAALYSSTRSRALRTAAPLGVALNLEVRPLAGLADLSFGEWEGLTPDEVAARWPELYQRWLLAPQTVRFPGGESLGVLRARAYAALEEVVAAHAGRAVVLVTHKVVCKVLLCAALGLDDAHYWQIEMDNASLSVLEHVDGLYVLTRLNDTCHLGG